MYRKFVAVISGLTILSATALAQTTCDPAKLATIVDGYASAPFSAATWRVLGGLGNPATDSAYKGVNRAAEYDWDAQEAWKKIAEKILPPGQAPQSIGYDCRISYPLEILKGRIAKLGIESKYVKQWFTVQEQVLKACSDPATTVTTLPNPLEVEPALTQIQNEDRAYQEASIAFYKDKPKAIELFRAIGNSNSPHKAAARYNIANLMANAKNITGARSEAASILADPTLASVHGITQNLLGYISNIEDTPAGWTALIDDSIATVTAPKATILSSPKMQDDYARSLDDIDHLGIRAKTDDWWLNGKLPENATVSKAIFDASRKHPMALWMLAGQTLQQYYDEAPWALVGDKWQQRTTSYLDQVIAVTPSGAQIPALPLDVLNTLRARPDDATREALWGKVHAALAAAQQSCGEAPETAALGTYINQAVRVSAATEHFDQAYDELSKLPFKSSAFYLYGTLTKLAQFELGQGAAEEGRRFRDRLLTPELFAGLSNDMKTGVTNTFAQFMGWVAEDEAHWKQALALYGNKTEWSLLNFQSMKSLWAYAEDPMFSDAQKALLTRVAWTRKFASGGTPTAEETAKLFATNPQVQDADRDIGEAYPKLSPERRRLLTILRNPRLGIQVSAPDLWSPLEETGDDWTDVSSGDHNDRNWWCPLETDRHLAALRQELSYNAGMTVSGESSLKAVFDAKLYDKLVANLNGLLKQHPMVKAVNWKEITRLQQMPSAPKLLTQAAIRWGKAGAGDDAAAEALAQAVRVTHYGCNWHGRVGAYSKPAQQLLQAKFPTSSWAKQTPYWFDCQRMEWDKDYNKKAVCEAKSWPKQAPLR
jgi:hypothetical protein